MNVLFLIFTHDHGVGGHYFSFNAITQQILGGIKGERIELGWNQSTSVVADSFIQTNPFSINRALRQVIRYCKDRKFTHVHCFDIHSAFFGRALSLKLGIPLVVTRCGGQNPSYFPKVSNLTCFSKENLRFFKEQGFVNNLVLIPNRIEKKYHDDPMELPEADVKIVSIGRIGHEYVEKHSKSIQLVNELFSHGTNVLLAIIGVVEEDVYLTRLKSESRDLPIHFYTSKPTIKNSARFISNFDFCVGTGRGCMEAMQRRIPALVCSKSSPVPLVLGKDNFEEAFNYNFSMRVDCSQDCIDVADLIGSSERYRAQADWCKSIFDEHFNVEKAKDKYLALYARNLPLEKSKLSDQFKNWLYILKHYLVFLRKSWRN